MAKNRGKNVSLLFPNLFNTNKEVKKEEEFIPTFEVALLERNRLGEPYLNTRGEECKKCGKVHKYRVRHYTATNGSALESQFVWHRRRNPLPRYDKEQ